ncbi:hypothetical protein HPB48_001477 [Haemaphysalis longicornis]|uniref:Piwi domain-containing protein n=1 Tax=Haemaphysalis longicornis TaxID=44386 RepID=A0A9J6FGR4_HAELO|nr:hypothetical protein HPB48_001477 [Haemaphysalis longicornis]
MTAGADVTHPDPTEMNRPSAAAVVASVDRLAFRYVSTLRIQMQSSVAKACVEVIEDMNNIAGEPLVGLCRINNGVKPENVFRDGVSEGQFSQVQQYEVAALQEAYREVEPYYKPATTFLAVLKRQRHTRFMPRDRRDSSGKSGDIPPGAVIDTVFPHPVDFDFFLCFHFGIRGTSRPAHYWLRSRHPAGTCLWRVQHTHCASGRSSLRQRSTTPTTRPRGPSATWTHPRRAPAPGAARTVPCHRRVADFPAKICKLIQNKMFHI